MATTTPNYGWTVPTSTDLVKDGATAIETLGDAIDASMNTALGTKKAGMILLNTTSFSGVASTAVNSVFSATYQNYKIVFTLTSATADTTIKAKLRSGVTDNSASFYNFAMPGLTNGGSAANESSSPSSGGFLVTYSDSTALNFSSASIDLYKPFLAVITTGTIVMTNSSFSNVLRANAGGWWHEVASSFDGINFISDSGNITGEVSIYGYNK